MAREGRHVADDGSPRRHPERFEVFALTAHNRVDELLAQCLVWQPKFAVLPEPGPAQALQAQLRDAGCDTAVLVGPQALCEMASHPEVDAVMAAIEKVLDPKSGAPKTPDIGGNASTSDVGRAIAQAL